MFCLLTLDGPNKPQQKRKENVKGRFGTSDLHSILFKKLLDACGLEWWNVGFQCDSALTHQAPGEAEAELALMNTQGKIDAVLSDDVDALLFGAKCLLRK